MPDTFNPHWPPNEFGDVLAKQSEIAIDSAAASLNHQFQRRALSGKMRTLQTIKFHDQRLVGETFGYAGGKVHVHLSLLKAYFAKGY